MRVNQLTAASSAFWVLGAISSVLLIVAHLPFTMVAGLLPSSPWWAAAPLAVLLIQAACCLACAAGWFGGRGPTLAAAVVMITAAHGVVAAVAWTVSSPHLWLLWIGPIPVLAPALLHAAVLRRSSSR